MMMRSFFLRWKGALLVGLMLFLLGYGIQPPWAWAERISDVRRTLHNLSVTDYTGGPTRTVKAETQTELCVFCHTPHGSTTDASIKAPLWNRTLSTATYSGTYESTSLQANINELRAGPGGTSKLCLSCHDGTIATGSVSVLAGQFAGNISMSGIGPGGVMPSGSGTTTGFTRNLGTDLSNDHPISFTYDTTVATADGELRFPPYTSGTTLVTSNRLPGGAKPLLPLDDNKVQCASCHDPHIRESNPLETTSIKFLRLNRFQKVPPSGTSFTQTDDIICLACHDKGKEGWAESVHANSTDANETYKNGAGSPAALREFPDPVKVWEAACLNCHDTHTVPGSRRLLREGTDSTLSPKQGGNPAIEETCFQCHRSTTDTDNILETNLNDVPDIMTLFTDAGNIHMPITTGDQAAATEVHDITDADFQEAQATLGKGSGNLDNRHAECTDCHNPHRVMKNRLFNGTATGTAAATHQHAAGTAHSNIASGALRGIWGVEPTFNTNWLQLPTAYTVKKGDGGMSASTSRSATHLTREYQICLKCHSDYGYDDNGIYPTGNRPNLVDSLGGTLPGTTSSNGITQFTNQAAEFAVRADDAATGADQGVGAVHRSWHPVTYPTGRSAADRGAANNNWKAPFNAATGTQTMYCSDCHGSPSANATSVPTDGVQGPHGSSNKFILRGDWGTATQRNQQSHLCFKCHDHNVYATRNGGASGFGGGNYHDLHADKSGNNNRCTICHIAVPHGWKNKSFLVNLNSLGPEVGLTEGVPASGSTYNNPPYYLNSILRVKTWQQEGSWTEDGCGVGNDTGRGWMEANCG